jgi:hypothetical protein
VVNLRDLRSYLFVVPVAAWIGCVIVDYAGAL